MMRRFQTICVLVCVTVLMGGCAEGSSVSAAHGKNLAGTDTLTPVTEAQYDGEGHFSGTYYTFYVDNATGVEYIVYQSEVRGGYSTAITPRLNHDGTLVIKK
ncbi:MULTISPECIES: DUF6440 family protein [Caproicibacterium]|uniref:DUF6440 family protein n=1 Tax=Caproicibacterium argilliputei TaxID=3030016 RepID=A0AA97H349_9FIRM|nr:DUF6440 family protein [Caproicibacterium argilliputei]WOC33450.1 DUF6440 family protein [Caproicibacterium argilliputei]